MPPMPFRSTVRCAFLVLLASAVTLLGAGCASDPGRPRVLRLVTGSEGGTYYAIGRDLSRTLKRTGFRVPIEPQSSRGTEANLDLLRNGEAELALVTQDAVTSLSESERAAFCVVGPLYRGGAQFILRAALVRTGTVADVHGVHFYPGSAGSGTEASTLGLLEALQIRPDYVPVSLRTLGYDDSARALAEGKFDGVVLSGGPPVGAVAWLLEKYPRKFRLLVFTEEQMAQATSKLPGLYPGEIAGGVYAGHPDPLVTVGKQTVLIARAGMDEAMLADLAEAVERSLAEPGRGLRHKGAHPMLQGLTPEFWNQPLELRRCGGSD